MNVLMCKCFARTSTTTKPCPFRPSPSASSSHFQSPGRHEPLAPKGHDPDNKKLRKSRQSSSFLSRVILFTRMFKPVSKFGWNLGN